MVGRAEKRISRCNRILSRDSMQTFACTLNPATMVQRGLWNERIASHRIDGERRGMEVKRYDVLMIVSLDHLNDSPQGYTAIRIPTAPSIVACPASPRLRVSNAGTSRNAAGSSSDAAYVLAARLYL